MMAEGKTVTVTSTTTSRQRPGSACEECRRRKLRCDRQPQCSNCIEVGVICTTTTVRPARGPKKGHLKALKSRIATLERCILEQQGGIPTLLSDESLSPDNFQLCSPDSDRIEQPLERRILLASTLSNSFQDPNVIPELVKADLDQLYFERVHPFIPVIQRARYFSWAKTITKSDSRNALQYAMWTLAASLSTHCQTIRSSLYVHTKKLLEDIESKDSDMEYSDIEQAQAWLLYAIYQFMQSTFRKGWLSAGRLFRLVQMMRLYEIDSPDLLAVQSLETDWVEVEEKRRTFWMAYILDRFANLRKGWPITLTEHVLTRLPMPEDEFQSRQPVSMPFLSETLAGNDFMTTPQSSFLECILLATICGRSLSHRHLSIVGAMYGSNPQEFWNRHEWIDSALTTRISMLSLFYPFQSQYMDPMLLFTKMIAQTAVLCLYNAIETSIWTAPEYNSLVVEYEKRSRIAAKETVELAKELTHLTYFKVHPFTPIPLCICADFLKSRDGDNDTSVNEQLQEILNALHYLKDVNSLASEDSILPFWGWTMGD